MKFTTIALPEDTVREIAYSNLSGIVAHYGAYLPIPMRGLVNSLCIVHYACKNRFKPNYIYPPAEEPMRREWTPWVLCLILLACLVSCMVTGLYWKGEMNACRLGRVEQVR